MDRIAQQADRAGQHRQQQLGQPGSRQADGADGDRPVGCAPVPGVITDAREGKRRRRIPQPRCRASCQHHPPAPAQARARAHARYAGPSTGGGGGGTRGNRPGEGFDVRVNLAT